MSFVPMRAGHVPQLAIPDRVLWQAHLDAVQAGTVQTVTAYDSVNASAMPAGKVHMGYMNGRYQNIAQVEQLFPPKAGSSVDISITVTGSAAAGMFDCETGNGVPGDCPTFWRLARNAGFEYPIIYCPASWTTAVRSAMTTAGIASTQYLLIAAHYGIGAHICGSCGYPESDGTQWTDVGTYDISLLGPRFVAALFPANTPPAPPAPPKVGDLMLCSQPQTTHGATHFVGIDSKGNGFHVRVVTGKSTSVEAIKGFTGLDPAAPPSFGLQPLNESDATAGQVLSAGAMTADGKSFIHAVCPWGGPWSTVTTALP